MQSLKEVTKCDDHHLKQHLYIPSIFLLKINKKCIFAAKFPPEVLITLIIKMADSEMRLSSGCSERIELAALISAFQLCKEQIDIDSLNTNSEELIH